MNKPIFVITGMSGSGKTTVAEYLQNTLHLKKVQTCTTRQRRDNEPENAYTFLSMHEFEECIEKGEMLEYVRSFDNYYGTQISAIDSTQDYHILCLDWRGAITLREQYGRQAYIILMHINDIDCLNKRIANRSSVSEEEIAKRLKDFDKYQPCADVHDHIIDASMVIDDVNNVVRQLVGDAIFAHNNDNNNDNMK